MHKHNHANVRTHNSNILKCARIQSAPISKPLIYIQLNSYFFLCFQFEHTIAGLESHDPAIYSTESCVVTGTTTTKCWKLDNLVSFDSNESFDLIRVLCAYIFNSNSICMPLLVGVAVILYIAFAFLTILCDWEKHWHCFFCAVFIHCHYFLDVINLSLILDSESVHMIFQSKEL